MKCKHEWNNVVDILSTEKSDRMQILMCEMCRSVKVIYKDINKIKIIHKPKR